MRSGARAARSGCAQDAPRGTDRMVEPATKYRYTVRPCRRKHCARGRSVTVTTRARGGVARTGQLRQQPGCRQLPDLPGGQPVEHGRLAGAGRHLARLHRLARLDDAVARLRRRRRVRHPVRERAVHAAARADLLRRRPTSPTRAPTRRRSTRRWRAAATATCSPCARATASCSSSTRPRARAPAGTPTAARCGTCAPTRCAPSAGPPPTPPGCRSCPGSRAATRPTAGVIRHALRITVPTTQRAYIHPATHWASSNTDPDQPPMGLRVRLKASYDISGLRGQARAVAQALKTYGALVADNAGSPRVYISGAVDPGWNDEDLNGIKTDPGERARGRADLTRWCAGTEPRALPRSTEGRSGSSRAPRGRRARRTRPPRRRARPSR